MIESIKAWFAKWWPWLAALLATMTGLEAWRRHKQREADHVRALEEFDESERERSRTEKHLREAIDDQLKGALLEQADKHARMSVEAGQRADEAEIQRFSEHDRIKAMSPAERRVERMTQLQAAYERKHPASKIPPKLRVLAFLVLLSGANSADAQLPDHPRTAVTFDADGKVDLPSGRWWIMSEDEQVSLLANGAELEHALKEVGALREALEQRTAEAVSLRVAINVVQRAHTIATELRLDAEARMGKAEDDRKAAEVKASKRWRWFGVGVAIGAAVVSGLVLGAR